jgi:hypothetical protein
MKESEFLELKRLRQLEFYSDHLTAVDVTLMRKYEKKIIDWLWANTQGRFWVGEIYKDKEWKFLVCFEVPYEATFFNLKFLSAISTE